MDIFSEFHEVGHGKWTWELKDEFGTYLRDEQVFANMADACTDLEKASHLIRFRIDIH